jgi:hypothetical protein
MNSKDWRPTAFADTAPGIVTEQEAAASRHEQRSHLLAFLRRLLTLDTVALLLIATLIEKAFASAQRRESRDDRGRRLPAQPGDRRPRPSRAAGDRAEGRRPACAGRGRALLACSAATFLAFAVGVAALAWFFFANWLR